MDDDGDDVHLLRQACRHASRVGPGTLKACARGFARGHTRASPSRSDKVAAHDASLVRDTKVTGEVWPATWARIVSFSIVFLVSVASLHPKTEEERGWWGGRGLRWRSEIKSHRAGNSRLEER